ncbi:MAG: PD-(D/E)XK nuclease family protein [Bryobacterales bacterium]|nr:PD-(D/E)XK nuclease family protein [Bryobacterales bacterium]
MPYWKRQVLLFHTAGCQPGHPLTLFCNALSQDAESACLLVPTSTLAEHLRHSLAREGAFVRPDSIVTLSRFLEPYVRDIPSASPAVIDRFLEAGLRSNPPALFSPLAHSKGLRRMLVSLVQEVGQSAWTPDSRYSAAARDFHQLSARLETRLRQAGFTLRPERLKLAAQRLRATPPPWKHIFLTGFYAFTPAELEILSALQPADIRLSLPQWDGARESAAALRRMGFLESSHHEPPPQPVAAIVSASTEQEEADDIARRIVSLLDEGRTPGDIGILVRGEHPYVPLLRTTLHRYGIPARFYFQEPLHTHPLARVLLGFLDAIQSHWNYDRLLPLLEMPLSGIAAAPVTDQFIHTLRDRIPAHGLPPELDTLLPVWRSFEPWASAHHTPAQWAAEFGRLRALIATPAYTDNIPHTQVLSWRKLLSALDAWRESVKLTAAILPDQPIPLAEFHSHLREILEHAPITSRDQRRNVVHVLDVYEARQWSLPVVFLCGMLERVFPQYHSAHPILADPDRELLRHQGILLRTSTERQKEETFLFEVAASVAQDRLYLSYPRANSKGEETLPSFFLARFERDHPHTRAEFAVPARPRPLWPKSTPPPSRIAEPELLAALRKARGSLSPTSIETFLQCPFQFFARHILKLNPPPARPHERLDFLLQGNILHQTLAASEGSPLFVEEIFSRLFSEACREKSIPPNTRTETVRLELHANLRRFLESPPLSGAATRGIERGFHLRLTAGLRIRGKIDRVVDLPGRGLVVIDYKYSTRDRIRGRIRSHDRGELVQGGLYLWAAEQLYHAPPAGMLYCGLRGEITWMGWRLPYFGWENIGESSDPSQLREMMRRAIDSTVSVAARIEAGEIRPSPADTKKCAWCDYRDACRVETTASPLVQIAGGAS